MLHKLGKFTLYNPLQKKAVEFTGKLKTDGRNGI